MPLSTIFQWYRSGNKV